MSDYSIDSALSGVVNSAERRRTQGGERVPVNCRTCEDEGIVWFFRPHPETKRAWWFTARCTCSAASLPATYRPKTGQASEVPAWDEIMHPKTGMRLLTRADLFTCRIQPICDEYGKPHVPLPAEIREVMYTKPVGWDSACSPRTKTETKR